MSPARKTTARKVTRRPAKKAAKSVEGGMSVREAGRKGGLIGGRKGGKKVLRERGRGFYSEIGKKGGARVRELILQARALEEGRAPKKRTRSR